MGPSTVALVLVADDNAENRAVARATLEDEGYAVVLADDGEEAVAARVPDCVLLDTKMPKLDGVGSSRVSREQHQHVDLTARKVRDYGCLGAECVEDHATVDVGP